MAEAHDDRQRRAYWSQKMDEADAFMQQVRDYPVEECGEPVVALQPAASAAGVEVAFSARPHVRGLPRLFYLRSGLIDAFIAAAREMNERGWIMRVEDGFRTREMQKYLAREPATFDLVVRSVLWELEGALPSPEFLFRRLGALIASAPKVGTHMSGSAIDISVLDRATGQEVDRGGPYLEMSELTPMESPFVSAQAQANRAAISDLMRRHGFIAYPWEFWHYNAGDAYEAILLQTGTPGRYGAIDMDPATEAITPIADTLAPLNSLAEIQARLQAVVSSR